MQKTQAKKSFSLTWYQRYYRLLAIFKMHSLRKYDQRGNWHGKDMEYHHIRPLSIYGKENNLIVVVPKQVHARLHWLLWNHYRDKGMVEEAAKMKYAWETLDKKYGTSTIDEQFGIDYESIKECYKYLMSHYSI